MLGPILEYEGSGDSGVGASGSGDGEFTDVKRYAKQPIASTKTIKGECSQVDIPLYVNLPLLHLQKCSVATMKFYM